MGVRRSVIGGGQIGALEILVDDTSEPDRHARAKELPEVTTTAAPNGGSGTSRRPAWRQALFRGSVSAFRLDVPVKLVLLLALAIGLSSCSKPVEDTRPGQPVKTRQTAFKEMLRVFEPMGTMLRDGKYNAGKFEALAAELIARRNGPWGHFGADTNYPPTKARPEVWTRQGEFEKAREAFFRSSDVLLIAARTKELNTVTDAYARAYDACQSCHQEFKQK